jgi:uncharacterized protein (DUF2267 family)
MDELIKMVSQKVGIGEEQARQAVEVVAGYLRKNLPQPIATQIDAALEEEIGDLKEIAGGLGGLFGKG